MANLDDFIKDIREGEVIEIDGSLEVDMQWRIEEKILKEIPGDSSGGVRDGMFLDSFVDVGMTGEVLRSNEVKSITISGAEIELK